ncbi:Uncharacterized protein Fot_38051 [Forsythia ovata]|uniref:Uncharacterized protein n=1 Tax=Forsythia ovata TaxID=205694 RepID=A0ABD1S274_9LAMI
MTKNSCPDQLCDEDTGEGSAHMNEVYQVQVASTIKWLSSKLQSHFDNPQSFEGKYETSLPGSQLTELETAPAQLLPCVFTQNTQNVIHQRTVPICIEEVCIPDIYHHREI